MSEPIEIRRKPWDDSVYEKARLAFEMHHEMTYHEMCAVIERLRAERDTAEESREMWRGKAIEAASAHARLLSTAHALAEALQGWELLDKACEDASGLSADPAVVAATEALDETFERVWAQRDAALAQYRATVRRMNARPLQQLNESENGAPGM